jgi:hypothetical protein
MIIVRMRLVKEETLHCYEDNIIWAFLPLRDCFLRNIMK